MSNENKELCCWCKYLVNTKSKECVYVVEDDIKYYYCDKDCKASGCCEEDEDGEEEDGVYRLCGWCKKEYHIKNDPHYYDEELFGFCNEECFKNEVDYYK